MWVMNWKTMSATLPNAKMSRGRSWRDTCVSTGRDGRGRWLWRLVERSRGAGEGLEAGGIGELS